MTRAEWDALTAREKDALVGRALRFSPRIVHIATCDGGVSAAATTSRDGPWFYEGDLQGWLAGQHARGRMLGYAMGTWERWPHFTTSWDAMREVVERLHATVSPNGDHHVVEMELNGVDAWVCVDRMEDWQARVTAPTAPEAVCIAALTALGHMDAA
jgi:hypothetical protein